MSEEKNKDFMDLLDGRRSFEFASTEEEEPKTYYIGTPSAEDVRQADWAHAKAYNQALKEGIFTVSEMMEILKQRNIIGPEYDKRGEELRVQMNEKVVEMEREVDREKRMKLALEVADLREEVFQHSQRLSSPLSSTAENIANDARTEYITSAVVQNEDGSRVWETFEQFREAADLRLQTKARFEVMMWLEGVESDFLEKTPENSVFKELMDPEKLEESAPDEALSKEVEEAEASQDASLDSTKEDKEPKPESRPKKKTVKKKPGRKKKTANKTS